MDASVAAGSQWLKELAQAMQDERTSGAAPNPVRMTVRDLLRKFSYVNRGSWISAHIRNKLSELHLCTHPDFEGGWIHGEIEIKLLDEEGRAERSDPAHRVDILDAAHHKPLGVAPDTETRVAKTLMLLHDYSQLPVMEGERHVKGMISWRTIGAQESLSRPCELVRHCMEPAEEVSKDDPLLDVIGIIAQSGYVLVRDRNAQNTICGIVTATDLANQFAQIAGPFLLAGEIEGYLRTLIDGRFGFEQMEQVVAGGGSQSTFRGVADLSLGDYCHLLSKPEYWDELGARIDRAEFVKYLDNVRRIRNDIMHFSPEGISEEDFDALRDVAALLRVWCA